MSGVVRTGLPDTARSGLVQAGVVVARVVLPGGVEGFVGEVSVDPGELLTVAEVARLVGMTPSGWRSMVSLGYAPKPDDPGTGPVNRRMPRWRLETVREFQLSRRRRGQGGGG